MARLAAHPIAPNLHRLHLAPPPGQPPVAKIQASDIAEALAPYAAEGIPLSDFFHKFKKYINKLIKHPL
ncbi:hypothetical protein VTI74DRAFT_11371 [Chaetomium olivicolor]